ncbi:protocadherin Fat 4-like isoform X2 [Actinia tenebrosa]|uniref:Protocadherin Fat 4-like isoform X2 n=1 Tax=Actinia tenebrosa TaxID=6105 RepID=A0A6P8H3C6_ACTTE|nr:protocadherin Fat 4-like isoform X2 [Actinia tenebrosa]
MELSFRILGYLTLLCYLLHHTNAVKPVFQDSTPSVITEGLPPGTFYYKFVATDATPGHVVTYSLESKASEWFNINSATGNATVKKTIDREAMGSTFRYKVFASDGTNTGEADVIQQIRDINDNPPVFNNLPKSINIKEEGRFEFPNPADGQIKLKKSLDYDDGTKQFVFRIIAKNTLSSPYLNSTAVLTINVLDVDDLGAKFEKNLYETTLAKDSLPGTVVTTVQAKDRDSFNATVEYKIYQETNPGNVYKVNNNTGEITVNGPLTIGTQLLVVTATSTKHPPAFTVVKVNVASMLNKSYTVSVAEGQSNVVIFNLEPVERYYNITGGTFSIISSAQSSLFSIDGKNLKVGGAALDRETRDQYQLNIVVDKDGTRKGVVMVTINVLDINDNTPSFQGDLPYNASVREDADVGHSILRVTATDVDEGLNGTVKYALKGVDQPDLFSIENATGLITLAGKLDRETMAQYTLTIQAYDGGSPPKTNITTVIINVLDVNDNLPVLNQTSISKVVPEWATNGTEVAVVSATDADSGDNGRITYVIQEGADDKFVIDPNTGVITTTGGLSYTTKPIYTLVVNARDNGLPPRSATATVHVNIEPRTNKSYTEQVTEGAANVDVLSLLSVEKDYKVSGASFSFISGNDDNHFLIDAANKVLKIGSQPLDRELRNEYRLEIQVEKDGIIRGVATVTILVLDVNDNSPSFQGTIPYDASIKEDAGIGANIVKVLAKDSDSGLNSTVKYAITAGNDQGSFSMDNKTGQISLSGSLDREKTAQYTLTIQAYDGGTPPMTNTTTVIINVLDVNDNSPVMNQTLLSKTLSEWATNGTEVAVVSATDADSGEYSRITYVIQEGADDKFVIDPNTGVITTTGGLSYTTKHTYTIIVKARDHGSSPRSATTVVSVSVEPKTNKTYTVQVTENRPDEIVMSLVVVEQDYNIIGASFSISAGNNDDHFKIVGKDLKVGAKPLDREIKKEHVLRVTLVKDGKVRGVAMIIVNVLDVNDNSPAFQGSIPYSVDVKEDTMIGDIILKVNATDSDSGNNGTVIYSITGGNGEDRFSIENTTGIITLASELNRETTPQYTLTIQAYDGGSPPKTNTTTVIINLLDVNDISPSFSPRVMNVVVSERTSNGVQIAQVTAKDSDIGENSRINYSIAEGNDGKFDIDPNTGAIKIIGGLSFKERSKYMLIIDAKDNGLSPRTGSAIVYITITSAGQNLHSPVLKKTDYLGGVYKDTSDDQLILTVSATDADSGANGEVIYELTENPVPFLFHLETVSGRLRSANSFVDKEGELYIFKGRAKDKGSPPKNSTEANLCVFVLRDSHSLIITADVSQDFILKNDEEFRGVLDDLTGGKAFIKSVRPIGGKTNSSEIIFNVVKNKTESTSDQIHESLKRREDDIKNKYSKWNIRTYELPKTGKQISKGGLSAIVGAMICLALLIGVGGIIMIIILIKKRRERERIRRNARVTFNDEPHYINIDGNMPVSRLRHAESAQEAHQGLTNNMVDETSSVGSEEVQTSPDVMNCINEAYHNEDHDRHDQEEGFFNDNERVNFGTFFPPPPTEPPPPVPDSDADSLASEEESINYDEDDDRINFGTFLRPPPTEPPPPAPYSDTGFLASEKESINSDDDEPDYINAVLPPHEDFADNSHPHGIGEHGGDSPTHSHTGSTSQLINSSSYQDAQLHDPTFGFEALRKVQIPNCQQNCNLQHYI